MFRYVLAGSERGSVPLREELAFVDDYLCIEQARFGEHLRVTRDIAPAALDVSVPGLLLQPLVENAVQHGRRPDGSVDLALHVQRDREAVSITIADQGPGMPVSTPATQITGHGLRNVDERLIRTYGEAYRLAIAANTPAGTRVTLTIPVRVES